MDILKRLGAGMDQVELTRLESENTELRFEANLLKANQITKERTAAVRVIMDGRLGFAVSTADLNDDDRADKFAQDVQAMARFGEATPVSFPELPSCEVEENFDARIADLSIARLQDMGKEIVDHLLSVDPDLLVNIWLSRKISRFSLRNSSGGYLSRETSPLFCQTSFRRVDGEDMLMIYDSYQSSLWDGKYMEPVQRMAQRLRQAMNLLKLTPGDMPVLFSPEAAFTLLGPLVFGLNGANVHAGNSLLADKLGKEIFDTKLSIVDDPAVVGRDFSTSFDDEGVARSKTVFIENGVPRSFFYDLRSAALSRVAPTGHGFRGRGSWPPAPEEGNLMLLPGDTDRDDMIAGLDQGLYVVSLLGSGFSNIASGAFSTPVDLGYRIEKGEIVGRVKNVSIAGNIYDLLKDVAALSREARWIYGHYLPHILLPSMNVVGKG